MSLKKKPWNLAMWLVPPNLLLTSAVTNSENQEPVTTQPGNENVITPLVAPQPKQTAKVEATADFIWWKSYLGNMEYAWAGVFDNQLVQVPDSPSKGNIKTPDFDFAPGFKIGLGVVFLHDGWDLYANYTWLANQEEKTSVIGQSGVGLISLFPTTPSSLVTQAIAKATCTWEQKFNVLDLELGRNFFISRYLTLKPFFGLKFDWIEEEFEERYFGHPNTRGQLIDLMRKERVFGVGIRAGLDTVWHFTRNWGLYGDFAVTALWSDFHTIIKEQTFFSNDFVPNDAINSYEKIQQVTPVYEASLGLIYMLWFNKDRYLFYTKLGWEEQVWVHYNQIIPANFNIKAGNLSLHGLTAEVGFTF
jgi:hypothetical protein